MSPISSYRVLIVLFGLAGGSLPLLAGPPPFTRTNLVSGAGAPTTNGLALIAALAAATPNGCAAGNRRWLVHLEPGIFDLGSATLSMKTCVDVEGSGRDVTLIRSTGQAISWGAGITAEVRDLSIQVSPPSGQTFGVNVGSTTAALSRVNVTATGTSTVIGVLVAGSGLSPVLSDVAVKASSTANTQSEFVFGLYFQQSTPVVNNVKVSIASPNTDNVGIYEIQLATAAIDGAEVTVSGGSIDIGIWVSKGSSLRLMRGNVNDSGAQAFAIEDEGTGTVEVAYSSIAGIASGFGGFGIRETVSQGTVIFEHSTIQGSDFSIASFSGATNQVGASRLVQPINDSPNNGAPPATYTCVGAYNQAFAPLNNHCL